MRPHSGQLLSPLPFLATLKFKDAGEEKLEFDKRKGRRRPARPTAVGGWHGHDQPERYLIRPLAPSSSLVLAGAMTKAKAPARRPGLG